VTINDDLDRVVIMLDRKQEQAGKLVTFTPVDWCGLPAPRRQWCVDGFIPHANVTMLSGDGGLGKTLIAMQLQVAAALGLPWLGIQLEPIKSLGLYCEDDDDELHRRMADIAAHYSHELDALGDVHLASRVGAENLLVHFDKNDVGHTTALYSDLEMEALDRDVRLIVLDSLHDVFAGNEIVRTHARQFIGHLRRLALRIHGAVLLNAHPSLAGLNSGTGTSGSTAWNNAVRSRLYLTKPTEDDDNGMRVLKNLKSNYAALGNSIEVKWQDGVFIRNKSDGDPYGQTAQIFLTCLDKITTEGRHVSDKKNAVNYAPRMFARTPQAKGFSIQKLERAMEELFSTNKICVGLVQKQNRHTVEVIERVRQC
jgi:RecA-family ATPase